MQVINLAEVKESGVSSRLEAGGYVCKYTNVDDVVDKQYLLMEFDIAEGEFKGYYKTLSDKYGFWGGVCRRSYKEKALPMFKRMCSAVTKSNPGFIFDGGQNNADEKTIEGKLVGMVLGEEEYIKNNGDIGTRLYVYYECDVNDIRNKKFKVPAKKVLNNAPVAPAANDDFMKVDGVEEELPF